VAEAGFLQVFLSGGITPGSLERDQALSLVRGHTEIEDEVFARQAIDVVFEMLDPGEEFGTLCRRNARGLVRQVGADVAVNNDNLAVVQRGFQLELGFETVAGIEQGREMGVDAFERAEISVQKLADHLAEPGIVLRETRGIDGMAAGFKSEGQEFDLRTLAAAVDAFDGDEFSGSGHLWSARERHGQRSSVSLAGETPRRNAARARIQIRT